MTWFFQQGKWVKNVKISPWGTKSDIDISCPSNSRIQRDFGCVCSTHWQVGCALGTRSMGLWLSPWKAPSSPVVSSRCLAAVRHSICWWRWVELVVMVHPHYVKRTHREVGLIMSKITSSNTTRSWSNGGGIDLDYRRSWRSSVFLF